MYINRHLPSADSTRSTVIDEVALAPAKEAVRRLALWAERYQKIARLPPLHSCILSILFHFGWIDSTLKKLPDGRLAQRLSPRRKKSHWTKLNMDRCMDLEDRGLMTPAGRRAFENAYGWGYQVFHPTPEQRKQMISECSGIP